MCYATRFVSEEFKSDFVSELDLIMNNWQAPIARGRGL
jgi:hypothetical protein